MRKERGFRKMENAKVGFHIKGYRKNRKKKHRRRKYYSRGICL